MDTLTIPAKHAKEAVTVEYYPMFDQPGTTCLRIEFMYEVAYWHSDGTNDIMRGEKGTLVQAMQALINFATKED